MKILSVESSCDETAVAIVRDGREILTDCIASQVEIHKLYGGVVPRRSRRRRIQQIKYSCVPVLSEDAGILFRMKIVIFSQSDRREAELLVKRPCGEI